MLVRFETLRDVNWLAPHSNVTRLSEFERSREDSRLLWQLRKTRLGNGDKFKDVRPIELHDNFFNEVNEEIFSDARLL
ncbi:hypothetical protein D9M69_657150 [compost metagenome]